MLAEIVTKMAIWTIRRMVDRSEAALSLLGVGGALKLLQFGSIGRNPAVLRRFGAVVGDHCMIHSPLILHNADQGFQHLEVGEGCHIGKDVFIDLTERVTLEECVTVSMRVTLLTHFDVGRSPLKQSTYPTHARPVRIRHGAYIGSNAVVLAGVNVGEEAVVAAGAVVTEDVPARSLVAGTPARVVRALSAPAAVIEPREQLS